MGYCKKNHLCTNYCIVVDYSIYSGKERLFIVDLDDNKILYSTLYVLMVSGKILSVLSIRISAMCRRAICQVSATTDSGLQVRRINMI